MSDRYTTSCVLKVSDLTIFDELIGAIVKGQCLPLEALDKVVVLRT